MAEFPIIEKLGGRDKVFAHLKERGLVTTRDALRMWTSPDRAGIPGNACVEIMRLARAKRVRFEPDDFELADRKRA